jgi:error-prone DNA polymerase
MYVPLFCKSNFSFLEGASFPEELMEEAASLGLKALALTDRDGVYGVVRAFGKAQELGCKLITGATVSVDDGSSLVLLAQTREGYGRLCQLLTLGRRRSAKGESQVTWGEVCAHAEGLLALWGGAQGRLAAEAEPDAVAGPLREAFGDRLYALVTRHLGAEEVEVEARLLARAARHGLPRVAAVEVLYHQVQRRRLQDVLTCIRHKTTLHQAGRRLRPNAEHALLTPLRFAARFADLPDAIARTQEIADRCGFKLGDLRYRYPSERLPDGTTTAEWLRKLCFEGAHRRYGALLPEKVAAQLEKELELIGELDFAGYFLTMWEIVEFCRAQGILCQGRGSAANSVACFALGITAIDPTKVELLFERFLSRERAEPPDIDLDIEHERREEVIQHVYAKYGRSHAAMVANVISYRSRSAIRDVGKALGLPEAGLERLAQLLHPMESSERLNALRAELEVAPNVAEQLVELAGELEGFPRHLSIHPGGFLLGHDPVSTLVPIENATMEDRTVIQWNKDDVEALGLFKVDLLGLGALTQLHRAFDLLKQHRGLELTMATIPQEDPATYADIQKADTVGVFQIESRAQMSMLPRLKPKELYDLVVQVAIVRPGPISGGMVHPYLRRRTGAEEVSVPHPLMWPVLERTLGVPLFQEQVMKLAMVVADYTAGDADRLRRDMAAWRRTGKLEGHRGPLIGGMVSKGIPIEFAEALYRQIQGFGEYGFPESHAASFALIAYAGAWLKTHHPEVFTCALLNAQPMGFYSPSTLVEDAKRHDVEVRPIDVRQSDWDCTLEPRAGGRLALRMGLRFVKGLSEAAGRRLAAARAQPLASVEALGAKLELGARELVALAEAGALESLEPGRREALWRARGLAQAPRVPMAFDEVDTPRFAPLTELETIGWDHARTAHSVRGHPLGPLRGELRRLGLPDARSLITRGHGSRVHYAGLVIGRQRPGTASGVVFMTLEDETGWVNVIVWARVFDAQRVLAQVQPFLGVTGELQTQDGVTHLIAERFWVPRLSREPAHLHSRDFH